MYLKKTDQNAYNNLSKPGSISSNILLSTKTFTQEHNEEDKPQPLKILQGLVSYGTFNYLLIIIIHK